MIKNQKTNLAKNRKVIGVLLSIIAIVTTGIFIAQTDFSIQLQSYLSLNYCMQFVPLVISILLLSAGIHLYLNKPSTNFALVLFGYAALEEILFYWFGITSTYLSTYSIILFLGCAIIALWIAHTNAFNLKQLSNKELIFSIAFGAIESLLPLFL